MRPNTIHAVYTPTSCVTHGGHFYSTSTMRDTLAGMYHTAVLHQLITNTDHPPAYAAIRRLVDLFHCGLVEGRISNDDQARSHIPDVGTVEGLVDLLSTCTITMLLGVLDFRVYGTEKMPPHANRMWELHDDTPLPLNERLENQYSRGQCTEILDW
ncbi:hypothetical protein HYPSUDRAFT_119024, partial [Hypholoma sublateritium FD-334 SS-4]